MEHLLAVIREVRLVEIQPLQDLLPSAAAAGAHTARLKQTEETAAPVVVAAAVAAPALALVALARSISQKFRAILEETLQEPLVDVIHLLAAAALAPLARPDRHATEETAALVFIL